MTTIREARTPFDGDPDEQALAALEQDMLNDDVPRPNTALEPAGGAAVEPAEPAEPAAAEPAQGTDPPPAAAHPKKRVTLEDLTQEQLDKLIVARDRGWRDASELRTELRAVNERLAALSKLEERIKRLSTPGESPLPPPSRQEDPEAWRDHKLEELGTKLENMDAATQKQREEMEAVRSVREATAQLVQAGEAQENEFLAETGMERQELHQILQAVRYDRLQELVAEGYQPQEALQHLVAWEGNLLQRAVRDGRNAAAAMVALAKRRGVYLTGDAASSAAPPAAPRPTALDKVAAGAREAGKVPANRGTGGTVTIVMADLAKMSDADFDKVEGFLKGNPSVKEKFEAGLKVQIPAGLLS